LKSKEIFMLAASKKGKHGVHFSSRAKVTTKGQVTLPVALRQRLGLRAGDTIVFETNGNQTIVVPQRSGSVFEEYRGIGTGGVGGDRKAVLEWVREVRGEL
jgi:AbrB family looped-hinge helix DNA binding protein